MRSVLAQGMQAGLQEMVMQNGIRHRQLACIDVAPVSDYDFMQSSM